MNSMLQRLIIVFGEPNSPDVRKFLDEYSRATDHTDVAILEAATDILLATQTHPGWPTIGECRAAISKASPSTGAHQSINWDDEQAKWQPPSEEARARINAMMGEFNLNIAKATANMTIGKRKQLGCDRTAFENRKPMANASYRWVVPDRADSLTEGLSRRSRDMTGERDE